MILFFDFDDVLFNTKEFSTDFDAVFENRGISAEDFQRTYAQSRHTTRIPNYNNAEHMRILSNEFGIDQKLLHADIRVFLEDTSSYLFSDVCAALAAFKEKGIVLCLVSYGKPKEWQDRKVYSSGVTDYFDEIVIGEIEKGCEAFQIQEKYADPIAFFVDDRIAYLADVRKDAPRVSTVLMLRPEGRYHDTPSDDCDFVVRELCEVQSLVTRKKC